MNKEKSPTATSTIGEPNMTRKDSITATMERNGGTFSGVKFDKQGNIKRRIIVEVEPFNSELIFSNEVFLKYIIIQLRKYLEERLTNTAGGYICFGNEDLEDRWIVTEQFCEEIRIDFKFIPQLIEYLDYPDCEGDFVNDFSVEEILEAVRNYQKDDGDEQNKSSSIK